MAELHVGSTYPIKHKVFWKGEPTDADDLPTVFVYDVTNDPTAVPQIDESSSIYDSTATKSEIDTGVYELVLPNSLTSFQRELRVVWEYEVEGMSVSKTHKIFVVTPYTDLEQAIDSLGFGSDANDPNHKTYKELLEAERWARKVIENYTGQQFYLYDDVHIVYPTGSDVLPLPYKLNTLHELYRNDILLIDTINEVNNWNYDTQISESGFGLRVNRASMLDNTVYTANGMVPPSINDSGFGAFSNGSIFRVQGRYGWEDVPDEVELACIELIKDYFSKDKLWRNKYVHSVQSFDWHFEYNEESYRGTGNVYVDQILLPYVLTQMVVI